MLLALVVGYWQASVVGGDEAECFCRVAGVSIVLLLLRAALCSCLAECSCKKKILQQLLHPKWKEKEIIMNE